MAQADSRSCTILAYHEIALVEPGMRRSLVVSPRTFAGHLRVLRAIGSSFISLEQLAAALHGEAPLPRNAVAITFDDGYTGISQHALPILARFACPATVFVISGQLGERGEGVQPPSAKMTTRQLRELIAAGHAIGSHTRTHPDLLTVSDEALRCEIEESKRELEELLETRVSTFCYPFGHVDERVRLVVRDAGYALACTIVTGEAGPRSDRYALPRVAIGHDLPSWNLAYRLWRLRGSTPMAESIE